jgi:hypothetical protein
VIHGQNTKFVSLLSPASVGTSATVSGTVDCVGWDYAQVFLHLATQTAGNTNTISLAEGDTTSGYTTHADMSMTTATPSTSATQVYGWMLDLRKRKRYLKLTLTVPGTAQAAAATVLLSRGEVGPDSATERGLTAQAVG